MSIMWSRIVSVDVGKNVPEECKKNGKNYILVVTYTNASSGMSFSRSCDDGCLDDDEARFIEKHAKEITRIANDLKAMDWGYYSTIPYDCNSAFDYVHKAINSIKNSIKNKFLCNRDCHIKSVFGLELVSPSQFVSEFGMSALPKGLEHVNSIEYVMVADAKVYKDDKIEDLRIPIFYLLQRQLDYKLNSLLHHPLWFNYTFVDEVNDAIKKYTNSRNYMPCYKLPELVTRLVEKETGKDYSKQMIKIC